MALEVESYSVSMKFAIGSTSSGATKLRSVSIGALNKGAYNAGKALALANALRYAFPYMLYKIVETRTGMLLAD